MYVIIYSPHTRCKNTPTQNRNKVTKGKKKRDKGAFGETKELIYGADVRITSTINANITNKKKLGVVTKVAEQTRFQARVFLQPFIRGSTTILTGHLLSLPQSQ